MWPSSLRLCFLAALSPPYLHGASQIDEASATVMLSPCPSECGCRDAAHAGGAWLRCTSRTALPAPHAVSSACDDPSTGLADHRGCRGVCDGQRLSLPSCTAGRCGRGAHTHHQQQRDTHADASPSQTAGSPYAGMYAKPSARVHDARTVAVHLGGLALTEAHDHARARAVDDASRVHLEWCIHPIPALVHTLIPLLRASMRAADIALRAASERAAMSSANAGVRM